MSDIDYLKLAIQNAQKSFEQGNFPAGAIVVKDDRIISSEVSSPYPGLFHADSKAIQSALNTIGPLVGATLYIGLESCLMCTGVVYWSGIRRVVYAIPKSRVDPNYYETSEDTKNVVITFHDPIEFIHLPELEDEALNIVKNWESRR
jgi:tRNA(adenine34) deaminase